MADSDKSLTNLRYNQVTQGLEGFGGGSPMWTPLVLAADGGITMLTGDATAGPGSGSQVLTLASTAVTPGSYTNTNLTVDAKGRITAAANGSGGSSGTPSVFAQTNAGTNVTGTTYTNVGGVSVPFALSNATHRVKVTYTGCFEQDNAVQSFFTLAMDGTPGEAAGIAVSSLTGAVPLALLFIFSPGDTASHTFTIQAKNSATGSLFLEASGAGSFLVEEII